MTDKEWDSVEAPHLKLDTAGPRWQYRLRRCLRLTHLIKGLKVLVPGFLRPSDDSTVNRTHPTAYLDGMRGCAAFIVSLAHFMGMSYGWHNWSWGALRDGVPQYSILQLPPISILFHGRPMVPVFFVISGFAISYKPLKLVRSRSLTQLLDALASSTFRRIFRLFLPCMVTTFCMAFAAQVGWWSYASAGGQETIFAQFVEWLWCIRDMLAIFNFDGWGGRHHPRFDPVLWTIPLEFRGSMIVFTTILGLAKMRAFWRLTYQISLTLWCLSYRKWDVFQFLSGMCLAELHHHRRPRQTSHSVAAVSGSPFRHGQQVTSWSTAERISWILVFFAALFVLSVPDERADSSPGFVWLVKSIPEGGDIQHLLAPGAVILVIAVEMPSELQALFTATFTQYLGRISYAIYIVHGPARYIWQVPVQEFVWRWTGKETDAQYAFGVFVTALVIYALIFWLADLVWRTVDVKSVEFANWLTKECTVSSDLELGAAS